ncbi:MmgE/PrpD family protein [Chelativorans xinjiangense]|uniref:MmgE/PrpD family protein n=1 Tax=Chelativorans xinjiangense TaxID=2681485 RepID=UPI001359461D|nr:MmgE/PrpD family protein [Chelativorans xinjiangense]
MKNEKARSVSERLAEWAATLAPEALPDAAKAKARDILVDTVGLCVAARGTDYVAAVKAAAEPGDHLIIGHLERASASSAALVNGTAAHGEDFDDTFEGGPVHSGAVVVPALIAAAERYQLTNDRLMLGIAAGTEMLCRLALTLPKAVHKAGFHPTAVLGTFGATFGICVACRAGEKVIANALGIAGSMASGIIEYLGDGSWTKRMHPGWSAQSALRAYAMAETGFVGPRAVFEGTHGAFKTFAPSIEPKTDILFEDLGQTFVMDTITFKPYPCGTMVQPYIDCAMKLKARGIPLEGIEKIVCKTAEGIVHRLWEPLDLKRRPPTAYAAKFSTPFGVALGLVRGRAGLGDFTEAAIADDELIRIAGLVDFEIDPKNPYPAAYTGHVRIAYRDGQVEEAEQGHMRGGVEEPLTRDEIDAKFRANLAFGGHARADALLALCDRIGAMQGGHELIAELGHDD